MLTLNNVVNEYPNPEFVGPAHYVELLSDTGFYRPSNPLFFTAGSSTSRLTSSSGSRSR